MTSNLQAYYNTVSWLDCWLRRIEITTEDNTTTLLLINEHAGRYTLVTSPPYHRWQACNKLVLSAFTASLQHHIILITTQILSTINLVFNYWILWRISDNFNTELKVWKSVRKRTALFITRSWVSTNATMFSKCWQKTFKIGSSSCHKLKVEGVYLITT